MYKKEYPAARPNVSADGPCRIRLIISHMADGCVVFFPRHTGFSLLLLVLHNSPYTNDSVDLPQAFHRVVGHRVADIQQRIGVVPVAFVR